MLLYIEVCKELWENLPNSWAKYRIVNYYTEYTSIYKTHWNKKIQLYRNTEGHITVQGRDTMGHVVHTGNDGKMIQKSLR